MKRRILWQLPSRYALVTCYEGTPPIVEKIICPGQPDAHRAENFNLTSRFFRGELARVGVPLVEPYLYKVSKGEAIQTCPYIGQDLEFIFKKDMGSQDLLNRLIVAISGVLKQHEPYVGIDARLSNFCIDETGGIFYVDTFPPLVFFNGIYLVHFPNPVEPKIVKQELFRKFKALGILRRLRFSLLEQDCGFKEAELLTAIDAAMGKKFHDKVSAYFEKFLDHIPIEEALKKITLNDPDGIRELALSMMPPPGQKRDDFWREIFNLSSNFCPYPYSTRVRMRMIRDLLHGV